MEKNKFVLSMEDFTILMLGMLAKNSKLKDLNNPDNKIACLPFNYKQIIENILCANNAWKDKFSLLINIDDYFYDHFSWEMSLSFMIEEVLKKFDKEIKCDFVNDLFKIEFSSAEVNDILNKYNNEYLLDTMNHFTSLLTDYIYTRHFQERFCDYSARAVKKMHDLYDADINEDIYGNKKNMNIFKKILKK